MKPKLPRCEKCLRIIQTIPVRIHRDLNHKYQFTHRICPKVDKLKANKYH